MGKLLSLQDIAKILLAAGAVKKELKKVFSLNRDLEYPKEYLLDFLVSKYFIGIAVKSAKHKIFNQEIHKMCENINSSNGEKCEFY